MTNPKILFEFDNKYFNIWAAIAAPTTLFWTKSQTPNRTRIREDHLIGLGRVFFREIRVYVWTLTLGRLRIFYIKH